VDSGPAHGENKMISINQYCGSGSYFLKLRNHFFWLFWGLKYFDEDPGSGMETVRIRDPEWRQFGSGIRDGKKSDPDPQHWFKLKIQKELP